MSTKDRVREQGFCYDQEAPPSVPAGAPLRSPHAAGRGDRRAHRTALSSLRGRLRRDS